MGRSSKKTPRNIQRDITQQEGPQETYDKIFIITHKPLPIIDELNTNNSDERCVCSYGCDYENGVFSSYIVVLEKEAYEQCKEFLAYRFSNVSLLDYNYDKYYFIWSDKSKSKIKLPNQKDYLHYKKFTENVNGVSVGVRFFNTIKVMMNGEKAYGKSSKN